MLGKTDRLGILIALAIILVVGIVLAVSPYSPIGVISEVGNGGVPLSLSDLSAVPQSLIDDATRLATELFGDYQEKYDDFVNQLLAMYSEAKDKDFVIVFISGGWGWHLVETSLGHRSIFNGMESVLNDSGYELLLLNYQRTNNSLGGIHDELVEIITRYSSKAQDLAARLEFLTANTPDLRIIIVGECHGSVLADTIMGTLEDNPQVYSIQTGPPFWHTNIMLDRTLVITDNGIRPDSFSRGELLSMIWGVVKYYLRLSPPVDDLGTPPHYVGAPGHDFWWQYPKIRSDITNFLDENFGIQ